jgi:hypothetical protein
VININVTKLKDGIKRFVLSTFVLFVSFVVNRMRNANRLAGGRSYLAPLMPGDRMARSDQFVRSSGF